MLETCSLAQLDDNDHVWRSMPNHGKINKNIKKIPYQHNIGDKQV